VKVALPAAMINPNHAVRVTSDQLVVCHGDMADELQRICTVNNRGEVLKSCKVLRNCFQSTVRTTVLCPSVCNICIGAKRCVLSNNCLKKQIGNGP